MHFLLIFVLHLSTIVAIQGLAIQKQLQDTESPVIATETYLIYYNPIEEDKNQNQKQNQNPIFYDVTEAPETATQSNNDYPDYQIFYDFKPNSVVFDDQDAVLPSDYERKRKQIFGQQQYQQYDYEEERPAYLYQAPPQPPPGAYHNNDLLPYFIAQDNDYEFQGSASADPQIAGLPPGFDINTLEQFLPDGILPEGVRLSDLDLARFIPEGTSILDLSEAELMAIVRQAVEALQAGDNNNNNNSENSPETDDPTSVVNFDTAAVTAVPDLETNDESEVEALAPPTATGTGTGTSETTGTSGTSSANPFTTHSSLTQNSSSYSAPVNTYTNTVTNYDVYTAPQTNTYSVPQTNSYSVSQSDSYGSPQAPVYTSYKTVSYGTPTNVIYGTSSYSDSYSAPQASVSTSYGTSSNSQTNSGSYYTGNTYTYPATNTNTQTGKSFLGFCIPKN